MANGDDPAEQWTDGNLDRYAEIMFNAFAPGYVTIITRAGRFEPRCKTWAQLSEEGKATFRDAARTILHRRDEWRSAL